jgi:hypothetical protein
MDTQNILRTIHRNQEQIDLLTANNTQLIEFLMVAGAQDALTSLARQQPPTVVRAFRESQAWPEDLPALPVPKKMGRPRGVKNKPRQEPEREVRYDSLGRRIPESRDTWTPERRAHMAKILKKRWKARSNAPVATKKQAPPTKRNWVDRKSPQAVAEWKRKLSEANRKARERKAALGIDYTTNKPVAKEVKL